MALQPAQQHTFISEQEYLDGELISDIKHEYIDGEVYAMAGASANHNRLVSNVLAALHLHLANSPCEVFAAGMKLKAGQNFFYPDLIVDCNRANGGDYYTDSPLIVVEVLSGRNPIRQSRQRRHASLFRSTNPE